MAANSNTPRPVLLAEYRPPFYLVDGVELQVDLYDDHALVRSRLQLRRNPAAQSAAAGADVLALDGEELELLELRLDGVELPPERYLVRGDSNTPAVKGDNRAAAAPRDDGRGQLLIHDPPAQGELETVSRIYPAANTALEGLYRSGPMFCTQCEPEGFRRITWYPDRPDVLAPFTVTISADRQKCPVLLAGGNPEGRGDLPDGRHWATFKDPFPKPSYLFALVAGDLVGIHDRFTTALGRDVALAIYVEAHNQDKCDHAMAALKKAMRWDEETFGLEYDLSHYLIVAVDDFTMGAMENKGLNIFNARYVLARPESATDDDFENIEAVIAHEYFHNWTGNRVTCRDWFQLSLKEGLTVFRDQLFSQALHSPGVKRINDVRLLREHQFAEDAGPLAHPVRPESYLEINNFYTLTVYEKGAELLRMLHTLLGAEKFRAGLRLYLSRHDGGAATIEDFLAAMAEAGGRDLGPFARWYEQAGTPLVRVSDDYDPATGRYRLQAQQYCPAAGRSGSNGSQGHDADRRAAKQPLPIPLAVGLLSADGREVAAALLELNQEKQEFVFEAVDSRPVPSLLRGFSAPVRLEYDYSDEQLRLLLAHDTDPFSRWEAGQRLSGGLILKLATDWRAGRPLALPFEFIATYRQLLEQLPELADKSLAAQLPALPAEDYLAEQMEEIDVEAVHAAREFVRRELAVALRRQWLDIYHQNLFTEAEEENYAGDPDRTTSSAAPCDHTQLSDHGGKMVSGHRVPQVVVSSGGKRTSVREPARSPQDAVPCDRLQIYDPCRAGTRRLRNQALYFLMAPADDEILALARRQFDRADNMTDTLAAMRGLAHAAGASAAAAREAEEVLAQFAARWADDPLVMDKWLSVQATVPAPETLARVRELMSHPAFRLANPNRVRALIGAFAGANPVAFHQVGGQDLGAGYHFLAEQVLALDPINPQVAARLAARLSRWRRFGRQRRQLMRGELEKIVASPGLSRDVYEMVSKSLGEKRAEEND